MAIVKKRQSRRNSYGIGGGRGVNHCRAWLKMIIKLAEERVRVGQEFPLCFDVESTGIGFTRNVSATLYTRGISVDVRKKGGMLAVFASAPNDSSDLPEYWQDAEILWHQPIEMEVTP